MNKELNAEQYRELIKLAQEGDKFAMNDILADMMQYKMRTMLYKYREACTAGSMIDFSDLQQTFLIAVAKAVNEADVEVGNPMVFLLSKGKWAVIDVLRSSYRRVIRQHCEECGATTRLNEENGQPVCPKCGAKGHDKIHREQFVNQDDGTILNTVAMQAKSTEDMTSDEELIADFRKRLSGKKLEVFDYIILKGFDRDGCKNYIKEIAEKMGVGQANINLRLRAIKKELKEYLAEIEEMDKYIESKLG